MRTTINISEGILEELRSLAESSGRPFRKVMEETLQRGLAARPTARARVTIESYPVGIKPAFKGMSMNQVYDQLEAEETLKVAEP